MDVTFYWACVIALTAVLGSVLVKMLFWQDDDE